MRERNQQPKPIEEIITFLAPYLHGKAKALKLALIAFFSEGHLLIEDLPGLGKTTLAIALAQALGMDFGRIQCTSDLLPSDITGLSVYNKNTSVFEFHQGPVFNNIVLVDEINRATPKTQSALLEAMGEKQTTVEGRTYKLARPFFVIATQNPVELYGTFPLPESQLDRFTMKISIGYPSRDSERQIIKGGSMRERLYTMQPLMTREQVLSLQQKIRDGVHMSDRIFDYILDIVEATRTSTYIHAGISTRGVLALDATARTRAYFNGRDFVIPEDVKELAEFTIPHRLIFREEFEQLDRREIVRSIVKAIAVPVS